MEVLATADSPLVRQRFAMQRIESHGRWAFPPHSHQGFAEIFYLAHGCMEHHIEGHLQHLDAGALVLVRERDHHRLIADGMRYFNLNLPIGDLARVATYLDDGAVLEALLAASEPLAPVQLAPAERREVEDQFLRLFDCQASPTATALYQRALVGLASVFARRVAPEAPTIPGWLAQAQEAAVANLAGMTPASMARLAGVSPAHLARSMRRHCGTTPAVWLNRCRLERAALRLTHTNQPIAVIAVDLGFATLGWFYRCFQRAHGCPPAVYRRRHGTLIG